MRLSEIQQPYFNSQLDRITGRILPQEELYKKNPQFYHNTVLQDPIKDVIKQKYHAREAARLAGDTGNLKFLDSQILAHVREMASHDNISQWMVRRVVNDVIEPMFNMSLDSDEPCPEDLVNWNVQ